MESSENHTRKSRSRKPKVRIRCAACRGRGKVVVPDLERVSLSKLAKAAGLSRSLISRMLSGNVAPEQKRLNPELETMLKVCGAIQKLTGTTVGLDTLAKAIRG